MPIYKQSVNVRRMTAVLWRVHGKLTVGMYGFPVHAIFGINLTQKGHTPLSDFYKNCVEGESPSFAPSRQILPLWL